MRSATGWIVTAGAALLVAVSALANAQQTSQAPPSPPPPALVAPPAGLPLIQFKVLVNVDYVSQEPQAQPPQLGFGLRRARLFAQLNGPAGLGFRLHLDPTALANGPQAAAPYRDVPLVEAYLEYALPANTLIRVGQQRVPYTLNATTGAPAMPVPEFDQLSRYTIQRASAFRDIGVTVNGRAGALEYAAGVFNGAGINVITDNDSTKDYAGRLTYAVIPGVQVGGSAWKGHSGSLFVRNVGAPPLKAFHDNADFTRRDIDVHMGRGALDLAAEYGRERLEYNSRAVNPTPATTYLERDGYNLTGALRLGALRLGALALPLRRWEVAGRYDRWDPNRAVGGDRVTEYVAGVNFYLQQTSARPDQRLGRAVNAVQRQSRIMAFWEWNRPETLAAAAPPGALLTRNTQRFHARWELFY